MKKEFKIIANLLADEIDHLNAQRSKMVLSAQTNKELDKVINSDQFKELNERLVDLEKTERFITNLSDYASMIANEMNK